MFKTRRILKDSTRFVVFKIRDFIFKYIEFYYTLKN